MATDPRDREYARLLVDTCIGVQPGWKVVVQASPLARPLLEEVLREIAERGAYALLRMVWSGSLFGATEWVRHAPLELLQRPVEHEARLIEEADAVIVLVAPENTRELLAIEQEKNAAHQAAYRPALERIFRHEIPWVGCQYPVPALAQDAGMPTDEYADFLYAAVLRDWDAERERMQRYADRFDAAEQVRIVGEGTDLTLSIAGRSMKVDAGGANIPGGEFFCSPVEDSAEGEITFAEYPAVLTGRDVVGVHLRFEDGKVVDASADVNEDFLLQTLDTDEGSRYLGELGIGCNPGITKHTRNILFDEKIDGTVHLALGNGIHDIGGTNVSAIHWDIVKDLRPGGRIELDGELVQEDGRWLI
jgi:aminopeptidase